MINPIRLGLNIAVEVANRFTPPAIARFLPILHSVAKSKPDEVKKESSQMIYKYPVSEAMKAVLERCEELSIQCRSDSSSDESFARYHGVTISVVEEIKHLAEMSKALKQLERAK